ncbi:beta-mannosidase [Bacteroidia bacterium]|nr:beta-mannosidase [Bacteroidia bacterium]
MKIFKLFFTICCASVIFAGFAQNTVSLNGKWELSYWEQPRKPVRTPDAMQQVTFKTIPATVPGNVELDLQAAGIIHDPMIGNNVWEMRPYEGHQWCYSRTFPTPAVEDGQTVMLCFGGIDCLADIWLNGKLLASPENMLIEHRYDVTDLLDRQKDNKLQVIIRSAVLYSQENLRDGLGRKDVNGEGANLRKAPHSYGWDILPRLVSAGLWRDVSLQIMNPIYFTDVFWVTNWADTAKKRAGMKVEYQLVLPFKELDKHQAVVTLKRNGKVVYQHSEILYLNMYRHSFTLENVELWWPRGYGDPALYEASVSIVDKQGKTLARDVKNIGVRTMTLMHTEITTPEKPGEFCFKVNGEKIFVKGTNWVPVDALHSRDAALLNGVMDMAVDLNCNMIRCWGGNVYEDHAFFDLCDRNGIMVWQDFSMACDAYPQSPEFIAKIYEEVRSVVLKLRNHPGLILWSGNNENDGKFGDPNRDLISRGVIPEAISAWDPTRSYLPSSPWYSPEFVKNGRNGKLLPEHHLWGPRGYYKDPFYTDLQCHFVSEIGYHGCPNRETLEKMFDKDFVYPWKKGTFEWNDQWQTKASKEHLYSHGTDDRNDLMINQVKVVFGDVPTDLDRFIFASQSVQAEAMKFFVELWRMDKFRKTGILWWNLRDGWPMISDAVTDYYNSKKLAYYYIKQVQQNACVMIGDANESKHPVIAVNDTREEKQGTVTVRDLDTKEVLLSGKFVIPVNGKTEIGSIPESGKHAMWVIEYTLGNEKFTNHYLNGTPPFKLADYERWYKKIYQVNKWIKNN